MKAKLVRENINEYVNREEDNWADREIDRWKKNKIPDFWSIVVGATIEYLDFDDTTILTGEIIDKGSTRDEDYVVVNKDGKIWNVFLSQIENYIE